MVSGCSFPSKFIRILGTTSSLPSEFIRIFDTMSFIALFHCRTTKFVVLECSSLRLPVLMHWEKHNVLSKNDSFHIVITYAAKPIQLYWFSVALAIIGFSRFFFEFHYFGIIKPNYAWFIVQPVEPTGFFCSQNLGENYNLKRKNGRKKKIYKLVIDFRIFFFFSC